MRKFKVIGIEALAIILFLIYMIPFALILINAAKPTLQILIDPLALPERFSLLFENIAAVYNSPNVRYPSAFMT